MCVYRHARDGEVKVQKTILDAPAQHELFEDLFAGPACYWREHVYWWLGKEMVCAVLL